MTAYTPEQASQIDWHRRWRSYGIPARYWNLGVADMQISPGNAGALGMARGMVETWPERRNPPTGTDTAHRLLGRGQIYIGAYATGKSRLACAVGTDIARRYNTSVLYMPVTEFFTLGRRLERAVDVAGKLRDEVAMADVRRIRAQQQLVETTPLLLWDDLGKEYAAASGWTGSEVYRILRLRYDNNRPTIVTGNLPLPEWSAKYEGSLFSFIHEAFDRTVIGGEDRRRAGK